MAQKMEVTIDEIEAVSLTGLMYDLRVKMDPKDRRPRFTDNGVAKWVEDLNEEDCSSLGMIATPASWSR